MRGGLQKGGRADVVPDVHSLLGGLLQRLGRPREPDSHHRSGDAVVDPTDLESSLLVTAGFFTLKMPARLLTALF